MNNPKRVIFGVIGMAPNCSTGAQVVDGLITGRVLGSPMLVITISGQNVFSSKPYIGTVIA
jgi:hypothetical protein